MTDQREAEPAHHDPDFSRYGDDRLREECGVFGVFGHPNAAAITALPQPAKVSQNVPIASAAYFFVFMIFSLC